MWLPRTLYEALPFYYLAGGLATLIAGLYVERGVWSDVLFIAGCAALVTGLVLLLKRRDYRTSRSRLDFDEAERSRLDR